MFGSPAPDTSAELALLGRQLARERKARAMAESVGERSTAILYETVQQLREAKNELRERAELQAKLRQLAQILRRDLDTQGTLRRAVLAIGEATNADRCLIRLADGVTIGPVVEQWSGPGVSPVSQLDVLPPRLEELCLAAARQQVTLQIDDFGCDPRLSPSDAAQAIAALNAHSYVGTPMWVGNELVGWLVLHAVRNPQPWTPRQIELTEGLASDLGAALLQAQAYHEKAAAVLHLEHINRVKSELVSTVSHELRTPLASITGYVEMLADDTLGPFNDKQHQAADVISRNARRLSTLIENLLTLSRADAGEQAPAHTSVDLAGLTHDVLRVLSPTAAARSMRLAVTCSDHDSSVPGNHDQLERLLLNLVSNAIKFTPGHGQVSITVEPRAGQVALIVTDTGLGIAEDDLPRVFDRFYRAETATLHAIQGSGLGLAVVKTIVEDHQGTIEISSTPGEGTEVTVGLPRAVHALAS